MESTLAFDSFSKLSNLLSQITHRIPKIGERLRLQAHFSDHSA